MDYLLINGSDVEGRRSASWASDISFSLPSLFDDDFLTIVNVDARGRGSSSESATVDTIPPTCSVSCILVCDDGLDAGGLRADNRQTGVAQRADADR